MGGEVDGKGEGEIEAQVLVKVKLNSEWKAKLKITQHSKFFPPLFLFDISKNH